MTPNDAQIDLLIRQFGARVPASTDGGAHLDADELNAFAEGALPPAARARYVSHLAECDRCRRLVSDLAIASGAMVHVAEAPAEKRESTGLWATISGWFSLPGLRYAAFAAVLVIVAGVAFVGLRRRAEQPSNLVAKNEGQQQQPVSAVKEGDGAIGGLNRQEKVVPSQPPAGSQTPSAPPPGVITTDQLPKVETAKNPEATTLEAPKEIAKAEMEPMKKAEARAPFQSLPSYAPAPPGESQSGGRAQTQTQTQTGSAQALGGLKTQQQADKSQSEDRDREAAKDARLDDASRQRGNDAVLAQRREADEKQKGGPSRNMDNSNLAMSNRNMNETRSEAPRKSDGGAAAGEEAPQTRSAGGRKFVRQGSRWVDQKFKSSMSLTNVSRGSDEFAGLDSGLRSIAQQLGGDVIVVWKGKAYLIK